MLNDDLRMTTALREIRQHIRFKKLPYSLMTFRDFSSFSVGCISLNTSELDETPRK
jgi:hypothetical protein